MILRGVELGSMGRIPILLALTETILKPSLGLQKPEVKVFCSSLALVPACFEPFKNGITQVFLGL